jgi:outer membrane lipoprotein-sorting protein
MKTNQKGLSILIAAGLLLGTFSAQAADPTPKEIMQKASDVRKLDGSESVMSLTIIDEKGEKRTREIAMAAKTYDNGQTEKRVYRFLSPADVKGTGVLAFDYDNKDDDMWIFLPALRKTRRIVSSEKSKSFMGSEFSNADMNTPVLDNYKLTLKGTEKVDGTDCYSIEALPKEKKIGEEEGYSKKIVWVAKSDSMIRKSDFYDADGKLLKELIVKNVKLVDDAKKRYRGMYMEMTNKQNNRKSIFETKQIENSPGISDDHFTTQYLERP